MAARNVIAEAWQLAGGKTLNRSMVGLPFKKDSKQLALRWLASPVNRSDVREMRAGVRPEGIGSEGVAIVEGAGSGVTGLQVGDWVVPKTRPPAGTWASHGIAEESSLVKVPSTGIPAEQAALFSGHFFAAAGLLEKYKVTKGDTLMVNGVGSAFGRILSQIAAARGVKVIGVVSNRTTRPCLEDSLHRLKLYGVYVGVAEEWVGKRLFRDATSDLLPPRVLVNLTGGQVDAQLEALAPGGVHVQVGGATLYSEFEGEEGAKPSEKFDSAGWVSQQTPEHLAALVEEVGGYLVSGRLVVPVERHYDAQGAVDRLEARHRLSKPVLVFEPVKSVAPSLAALAEFQKKNDELEWGLFQQVVKPELEGDFAKWREGVNQINEQGRDYASPEAQRVVFASSDWKEQTGQRKYPESLPRDFAQYPDAPRVFPYMPEDVDISEAQ